MAVSVPSPASLLSALRVPKRHGRCAHASACAFGLLALVAVHPPSALAHGIAERSDLPIPTWLFVWAAAVVLIVSFVALASLWPRPILENGRWRPLGRFGRALGSRTVDVACGPVGIFLLFLTVVSGLFGEQVPSSNFAPTFVYVVFFVGLVPVSNSA